MDLSTVEGLTPEQIEAISALHNQDVDGLKKNRDAIKEEKLELERLRQESDAAAEEARKVAAEKEEARLKATNDSEGLRKHYEEQLAQRTAELEAAAKSSQDALMSRDKTTELAKVLGKVDDRFAGFVKSSLDSMIEVTYEDGKPSYSYKVDGKEVAKDSESFISWAGERDEWKSVLKGVDSFGGGSKPSGGAATVTNKSYSEMTTEEKVAYLEKNPPKRM